MAFERSWAFDWSESCTALSVTHRKASVAAGPPPQFHRMQQAGSLTLGFGRRGTKPVPTLAARGMYKAVVSWCE